MVSFFWTFLALVAVARAGPGDVNQTFNGNDGGWRATEQSDPVNIEPLTGPECAEGSMARVIGQGMGLNLWFKGSEIRLYGVPPPGDVPVRYVLDEDEKLPAVTPHAGPPIRGACKLLNRMTGLDERLHMLTITVDSVDSDMKLYIANATVVPFPEASGSMSAMELPSSTGATHDAPNSTKTPLATSAESAAATLSPESTPKKSNMIIAAAAVGSLGLFFIIGFGVYWLIRRRRSRTPPSAAFRARMARADFVMVTGEHGHSSPSQSV